MANIENRYTFVFILLLLLGEKAVYCKNTISGFATYSNPLTNAESVVTLSLSNEGPSMPDDGELLITQPDFDFTNCRAIEGVKSCQIEKGNETAAWVVLDGVKKGGELFTLKITARNPTTATINPPFTITGKNEITGTSIIVGEDVQAAADDVPEPWVAKVISGDATVDYRGTDTNAIYQFSLTVSTSTMNETSKLYLSNDKLNFSACGVATDAGLASKCSQGTNTSDAVVSLNAATRTEVKFGLKMVGNPMYSALI
eukprot:Platyproteum_vivax@DN8761_c0_g1_i1.p1